MIDMEATGAAIKSKMIEKHYTVERLAVELGVTNISVFNWRSGKKLPTYENLAELKRLLECTYDEILIDERPS